MSARNAVCLEAVFIMPVFTITIITVVIVCLYLYNRIKIEADIDRCFDKCEEVRTVSKELSKEEAEEIAAENITGYLYASVEGTITHVTDDSITIDATLCAGQKKSSWFMFGLDRVGYCSEKVFIDRPRLRRYGSAGTKLINKLIEGVR